MYLESLDFIVGGRMFGINLENNVGVIWIYFVKENKWFIKEIII